MASKIELYREILEIEPKSKAFFPLARELAGAEQMDEAVAILHQGLGYHPDYLEAKFLLIDILTRQGREGEAEAVFADVGTLLAHYPSVWLLWSRAAAARSRDPSLAMLFLGHYFQNASLTWTEVLERGLRSLGTAASGPEAGSASAQPAPVRPEPVRSEPVQRKSLLAEAVRAESAPAPIETASHPEADNAAPALRGAEEVMICLGIESSCDETAVALCADGRPLLEKLASQADLHDDGDVCISCRT